MRRSIALVIATAISLCGCGDAPNGVPAASQTAGEYELVRFFGQPLPADNCARGTVEARHLSLFADQRYTKTWKGTACALGSCERADGSESGVWVVLANGSLYFDPQSGTGSLTQRVEANGRELRFMILTGNSQYTVSEVYERR